MIFSVAYQLTRCLLDCLMLLTRRETSRDAELLVLRHENAVLPPCITAGHFHARQTRRKPVLSGLINEYMRAA